MLELSLSTNMNSRLEIHVAALLTQGYTILPGILSISEVKELREVVDALYRLHDARRESQVGASRENAAVYS